MAMPQTTRHWTVEEVQALPDDGNRYEVVDGELLVTPAPSKPHQRVVVEFLAVIHGYLRRVDIGQEVLTAPTDVFLGKSLTQPDLVVGPRQDAPNQQPLLVVEVLSPSTARRDRFTKRVLYQRAGIAEYWIVDMDAQAIERWRPGDERGELVDARIEWNPPGASEPLSIDLDELFRSALG
jgi:Uma2 family endonuclease